MTSRLDDNSFPRCSFSDGVEICVSSGFGWACWPKIWDHLARLRGGRPLCLPEAMQFRGSKFWLPDTWRPALLFLRQCQGCAASPAGFGGLSHPQGTHRKQLSLPSSTDQAKRVNVPLDKVPFGCKWQVALLRTSTAPQPCVRCPRKLFAASLPQGQTAGP